MFTKKSREDKDDFYLTFFVDYAEIREYIPAEYNKFELWLRREYLNFMLRFPEYFPNYYYWNLRHLLIASDRKKQDLLFMAHVYNDHNGEPENRREKWFYNHCWARYGNEFKKFIIPKMQLNERGDVPNHQYALAYYKRWLREPRPNMKKLYHGVSLRELEESIAEIDGIYEFEIERIKNINKYQKRKLKNSKKRKN